MRLVVGHKARLDLGADCDAFAWGKVALGVLGLTVDDLGRTLFGAVDRAVGAGRVLNAASECEIDAAFATLARERSVPLVVSTDNLFTDRPIRLATLAARHAIPAIHAYREFAAAGGLMSYGSDLADAYRQVGIYAGSILKGAKPADLPVHQAVKVELVINLKTAKALGITFPLPLLGRADQVIE